MAIFQALLRELTAIFTGPHAHDREALDQGHIDGNVGDAARGEADDQQSAVKANTAHALIKHIAADGIIDDIGSGAAGDGLDLLAKAAGDIEHSVGGIFGHDHGQLLI